jgi:hydroxymethylbilane synthase
MLKIGTTDSKIDLWQAAFTQTALSLVGVASELILFKTPSGTEHGPEAHAYADNALLNKEIHDALLHGAVDLAVHSMENLPAEQPEGLCITAVSQRQNPADLLLIRKEAYAANKLLRLVEGAVIGATSQRRITQLRAFRPDVQWKELAGDAPALLEKLRNGACDAIFWSAAMLERLSPDLSDLEVFELPAREFVPAPGQGVQAWQTNRSDTATRLILKQLHHPDVSACTNIERRVLQLLGTDFKEALGVYCERDAVGNYHAFAACEIDGQLIKTRLSSSTSFGMAEKLVEQLRKS